jgi:cytochrome c556
MGKILGTYGRTLAVLAVVGLLALVAGQPSSAQVKKGKTRLAETKFLMRGVSQPNCAAIGALLKDKGPADDKAWEQVLCHAEILNELSYLLMDDGRCPDKDWAGAAKTLRECSGKVAEAAAAKKLEDAQKAFKALTGACGACHKVHKGK